MNIPTPAWTPIDPLGEALHQMRMSGLFYTRSEFAAPWGLSLPALPQMLMFHVINVGECWLELDGLPPQRLLPGDFALVPHGQGHRLTHSPGAEYAALFDLPREAVSERYEVLRHGGDGAAAQMICGAVRFDHPAAQQLVAMLPRAIHIAAADSPHREWMPDMLRFMADEMRALRPGGETIVTRLADILVIQAIRAWIERDPAAQGGWLGALRDKQIGRAIGLIHREPSRDWTLASLAEAVAMSRSAFAARFAAQVGMPAMQYLAQWRMNSALTELRERDVSIAALAERMGYQSEAAFSRAFKRHTGLSPGAARKRAAAQWPA
ncbi:MAG TPA: AraC family transcriptional regulator [Luteimonas sp.]|nr:AraC family transcriptional regulator [Luteimonas sp.]